MANFVVEEEEEEAGGVDVDVDVESGVGLGIGVVSSLRTSRATLSPRATCTAAVKADRVPLSVHATESVDPAATCATRTRCCMSTSNSPAITS